LFDLKAWLFLKLELVYLLNFVVLQQFVRVIPVGLKYEVNFIRISEELIGERRKM